MASKEIESQNSSFCIEYLKDFNGSKAAVRAGFSERSARQIASRLLTRDNIQEELSKLMAARFRRLELSGDRILRELYRIVSVDIAVAFNADGSLKNIHDIPEDVRRAISGIEVEELWDSDGGKKVQVGVTKKVKFWSKTEAANLLGKNLKLWAEGVGINLFGDGPVIMKLEIKT